MSHYTQRTLVEADIGDELIPAVLGAGDTGFDALGDSVAVEINGLLAPALGEALEDPLPPVVIEAGKVLFCYALFRRKQVTDDQNPFKGPADAMRERLTRIGRGIERLIPATGGVGNVDEPDLMFDDQPEAGE